MSDHIVNKERTLQFYKGENRMKVDIEGDDIFVLRDKSGEGIVVMKDEIDDVIALLTEAKSLKK